MSKAKLMEGESISSGKLHIVESYVVQPKIDKDGSQKIFTEAKEGSKKLVLKPRIEAIHAGRTRNHNIYPSERLRGDRSYKDPTSGKLTPSGVYSFTMPYPKPMVTDHEPTADNTTGRITNAQFIKDAITGRDMIVIIPEITSPDAIEKVLDGRYMTVSVGATTDSARCNICGKDIINEGWCEHDKGQEYDGVVAGWIVGNLWFDECSWVAVPADTDARVMDTGEASVMEAYIGVEGQFYDLANGTSVIKESVANTLGLVVSEEQPKGGSKTVSNPTNITVLAEEFDAMKEKADKVASLEEKVSTLESTIAEKETEINTYKEDVAAKDTTIAEKDVLIAEKDAAIQEKDTSISTLTGEKSDLEEKVATLEANVSELETDKQALVDQNTEMAANAHKDLVERVVDFKIALNKPGIENRDDAISEHMERAKESLKDSYVDLLSELTKKNAKYIPEKVQRPGVGAIPGEPNSTIEGATGVETLKELDTEEILKALFSGQFRKGNR